MSTRVVNRRHSSRRRIRGGGFAPLAWAAIALLHALPSAAAGQGVAERAGAGEAGAGQAGAAESGPVVRRVASVAALTELLDRVQDEAGGAVTIELAPGAYHLAPSPYQDPTCGNCEDPEQPVAATVGLRLSAPTLTLRGSHPDSVVLHTHAGYGLLIEDCGTCRLQGLTVTGTVRDTAAMATSAAIVVRRSQLTIEDCTIGPNLGDSAVVAGTVSGVMGICGREGARLLVRDSRILRNSWDGIALYRDAFARIEGCLIDGVDGGRSGAVCGGRGVAVGMTWNARAEITGNLIRRYWKGIGIFVDAEAEIEGNIVESMLTWGIALWDAGRGTPFARITGNAVFDTGACGISVTRGRAGGRAGSIIARNALLRTGQAARYDSPERYCRQEALALQATTPEMTVGPNWFAANREADGTPGGADQSWTAFRRDTEAMRARMARMPALAESRFLAVCRQAAAPDSAH